MYTNRFFTLLVIMAIVLVATLTVREATSTSAIDPGAEARPYVMDSATRSYIAWGQAMQVRNALDSGTRSSIAWGEALEAAELLGASTACSNITQEKLFAGIDSNLDSATRSYIAWGLALQAKNNIHTCH